MGKEGHGMKAVCLDFDRTLQDLDSAFERAVETVWLPLASQYGRGSGDLKRALKECWPPLWAEFMAGSRSDATLYPDWFERAFLSMELSVVSQEIVHQYNGVFDDSLHLFPDVGPALARLKAWGEPPSLAILTNGPGQRQRHRIRALGLDNDIPVWCISEEMGVAKPDPEFFRSALRTLDVAAQDAVMIGDNWENDIMGAKAVGMKAIWLNRNGLVSPTDDSVDGVASNLIEAVRIMESWAVL